MVAERHACSSRLPALRNASRDQSQQALTSSIECDAIRTVPMGVKTIGALDWRTPWVPAWRMSVVRKPPLVQTYATTATCAWKRILLGNILHRCTLRPTVSCRHHSSIPGGCLPFTVCRTCGVGYFLAPSKTKEN